MRGLLVAVLIVMAPFSLSFPAQYVDLGMIDENVKVTVLETDFTKTVVRFEIGGFTKEPVRIGDEIYFKLDLPGEGISLIEGEPELPHVARSLIIPDNARMNLRVIDSEYIEFPSTPIVPSKGNLYRDVNPEDIPYSFGEAYSTDRWTPADLVSLGEPYILRDFRGIVVDLKPFRYNHAVQTLRVYNSVTVEVYSDGPGEVNIFTRTEPFSKTTPDFNLLYNRRFINYNRGLLLYTPVMETGDMLVITYDAFHNEMMPLVEWKNQKGMKTTIVDVSAIGNTSGQISNFIQAFYDSTDLAYVLLVGDGAQVATPYASGGSSDPSYAKVAGGDHYPDIFIGRFSAENVGQVQTQVERTLNYEKFAQAGAWHHQATGIASAEGPGHHGEYDYQHVGLIRNDLLAYTYTLVDEIYDPGANASQVSAALNSGRGFINYCGHGDVTYWVTTGFSNSNVNSLTNTGMLPIIISVACVNGQFNGSFCFAEAWLRATHNGEPSGAAGAYMSSVNQSWNPPMDAQDEAVDLLIAEEKTTFGGICYNGSCLMIDINGLDGVEMYDTWHIFGDPSLQIYTDDPVAMTINHANAVIFTSTEFNVTTDAGGALCALYHNGVLYGSAYADTSGMAVIDIDQQLPVGETITLTITAYNKLPYEAPIQVIAPSGPYVVFDSCAVNDPTGNNNGLIDFGESIDLDVQLENVGPDTAYNVVAVLSTNDQYITVTDTIESFGTIAGDFGKINIEDAYAFDVSVNTPDQHIIPFQVQITGTALDTWTSYFNLTTHAPNLQFVDYAVNDASGNGNGILEAGETADLIVTLINGGSGGATSISGTLSENDDYVTITDASGVFGDLGPGASGDNQGDVFVVEADSSFPQGHSVTFDLALAADGGYTANTQFNLTTAESFEYNNGGYTGTGSWQWGHPTFGPPGAYYGVNVWGTNLSGQYPLNCNDYLVSVPHMIHSPGAYFEYYQWFDLESGWDGGNVSISTNGGSSWTLIHPVGGYPDPDVSALGGPGYTGMSGGWVRAEFTLSDYVGSTVLFRWRFASDGYINAAGWYIDDVVIRNNIPQPPPNMSYSPGSFNVSAPPGDITTRNLEITNNGDGPLYFNLYTETDNPEAAVSRGSAFPAETPANIDPISYQNVHEKSGTKEEPIFPPIITGQGGPDLFGHTWIDSDEPGGPPVTWVDISSVGTEIFPGEDNYVNVPIGFSFPFYENSYSDVFVCSNGLLTFGSGSTVYSNDPIPDNDLPNNYIAPWWDDLSPQNGHVYHYLDAANNRFIVSYVGVPNWSYGGNLNFQAVLYPDGDIDFNYAVMDPGNDQLNLSTIGIENINASDGLQIVYNADYMHDNLSIAIRSGSWLSVSPSSGIVQPTETLTATVTFDATDLAEGVYTGAVFLDSNDPTNPNVEIAATFNVSASAGCDYVVGDINNSGDFTGLDVTFAIAYFKGGMAPTYECECTPDSIWHVAGDVNATCTFNGFDVTYMVSYFKGGPDVVPCQDCPPIALRGAGEGLNSQKPGVISGKKAEEKPKDEFKR
ncbi:MAG: immune inhibitor A [Candidatus Zixiibacteriota bacterium]|nr:MAG: immune inhibitor A [candidate division Zixibacteria bacterium]